MENTDST